MPEQFENGANFDGKKSLQDFDAVEMYLHPKNQSVFQSISHSKASNDVLFSSFLSVYKMPFPECAG